MLGLLPKESPFFGVLNRHVGVLAEAARELHALLLDFSHVEERSATVYRLRERGQEFQQEMSVTLGRAFITPIDREDLHLLSSGMASVMAALEGTVSKFQLYHVKAPDEWILGQADVLVKITAVLVEGFEGLSRFDDCTPLWQKVKDLEREGDRLVAEAIAELFDSGRSVLDIVKWKEIHENLEEAIDRCEDVFDSLETVLVKHA